MKYEVMLDLETMGTGPTAAIVAIGAVKIDVDMLELVPKAEGGVFYCRVNLLDSAQVSKMDASTVLWWMRQVREVRKELWEDGSLSLVDAIYDFDKWVGGDVPIWGNGASFDCVILRQAYEAVGKKPVFNPFQDRCYRTMKSVVPDVVKPPRLEAKHHALADARWQAAHLTRIMRFLREHQATA